MKEQCAFFAHSKSGMMPKEIATIRYFLRRFLKLKEFAEWKKGEGMNINTPDELIALIQESIKKTGG